jgi:putative transposase
MAEERCEIGLNVGHRRVGWLMRQNGTSIVRTLKHKVTTDSKHKFNIALNLLDRNFAADAPNQKWAKDITYIWTLEGWLYLTFIRDLRFRRVIGWTVSNGMKRDLAIRALRMDLLSGRRRRTASTARILKSNIVRMTIRISCASSASRCP